MANFEKSYAKVKKFEGSYVNNPNDRGGETYAGISRIYHPSWNGWEIVDSYKQLEHSSKELNRVLQGDVSLDVIVEDFYKVNFWMTILGDEIADQLTADNIMDFAVNSGVSRAVKYAQRIVGTVEDGIMGARTIKAINDGTEGFVTRYKASRLAFVNRIVANDNTQKRFRRGWITRIKNA